MGWRPEVPELLALVSQFPVPVPRCAATRARSARLPAVAPHGFAPTASSRKRTSHRKAQYVADVGVLSHRHQAVSTKDATPALRRHCAP